MKIHLPGLLLGFLTVCAPLAHAAVIFDTNSGTYASSASTTFLNQFGKAVAFQTGSTAYSLDSLSLFLNGDGSAVSNSTLTVVLYSNDGSNTPGSALATLGTVGGTTASSAAEFVFTPGAAITLQANTIYWVSVRRASVDTGSIGWVTSSTVQTPPSPVEVGYSYAGFNPVLVQISNPGGASVSDPATWTSRSSVYNALEISGTAVPEPGAALAILVSGLGVIVLRRRGR